jgi:hypothetical protein
MLKIGCKRWSNTNINYQKVAVDNPSFIKEVVNSINNRAEGTDTVNSSEGLTKYYLVTYIIN